MAPPRRLGLLALVSSAPLAPRCSAQMVEQNLELVWPTVVWTIPEAWRGRERRWAKLAELAEEGFDRYVQKAFPKEAEADPEWAAEIQGDDDSKANFAFRRWQKRAWSKISKMPIEELDWDGSRVPQLKEVSYDWSSLYKSVDFQAFLKRVKSVGNQYLNSIVNENQRHRFKTFVWSEVFRQGAFKWPTMHTGAFCAGIFVAKYNAESGQTIVIEDERGKNPPFGRRWEWQPKEGEMIVFPSWTAHFFQANSGNSTNVFFTWLLWPPDGASQFDWEDDVTGDHVSHVKTEVEAKPRKKQASAAPKGSPTPGSAGGRKGGEL